jgi:hypothetical protein
VSLKQLTIEQSVEGGEAASHEDNLPKAFQEEGLDVKTEPGRASVISKKRWAGRKGQSASLSGNPLI